MNLVSDSFTIQVPAGKKGITTSVGISRPVEADTLGQPVKPYPTSALWDTGSSHCSISHTLAQHLELRPIYRVPVAHHEGMTYANVYILSIYITKRYYVNIEVIETKAPSDNFEIIIGMDVISEGDFALTSNKGTITFSFRLPSAAQIDFTKQ